MVLPLPVQPREQGHDVIARGRIQRSRRFIRQQDRGMIYQGPRHRYALPLPSRVDSARLV